MTVFNEDKEKDREQIDIDELNSLLGLSNEPHMGKLTTQDARHAYIWMQNARMAEQANSIAGNFSHT